MERNCDNCKYHDVYYNAPPCDECNFEYQRQPQKGFQNWESDAMTNADRIRSMTNEELANMWYSYVDCGACPMHRECNILPKDCLRLALEWLKSESEDDSEDN